MQDIEPKISELARRNRFFRFKQMRTEEFETEQHYLIRRRRLINRSVLGWGVVYGFPLSLPRPRREDDGRAEGGDDRREDEAAALPQVKVGAGLALDRHGREIELVEPVELGPQNTFVRVRHTN